MATTTAGGWWTAAGVTLIPAAANGLGRFAYGLVLPAMQHALGWSTLQAGLVGAANLAGYLAGALLADRLLVGLGELRATLGALIAVTVSLAAAAVSASLPVLLVVRFGNGVAAAVAFIGGAVAIMGLADRQPRGRGDRMLGLYFAGPGVGIVVSAVVITAPAGADRWRLAWLLLSVACAVCVLAGVPALRRACGTAPPPPASGPVSAGRPRRRPWGRRRVAPVLLAYGIFGAGYIAFMTFAVAYLRATRHASTRTVTAFWLVLGAAGVVIGVALIRRVATARGGRGLALLTAITAVASALPTVSGSLAVGLLAAALFGSFFSVSTAATAVIRQQLPEHEWPPAIAGLTAIFGLGQCAGPVLSGALSDGPAGLRTGLLAGTALLALSSACALAQRPGRGSEFRDRRSAGRLRRRPAPTARRPAPGS